MNRTGLEHLSLEIWLVNSWIPSQWLAGNFHGNHITNHRTYWRVHFLLLVPAMGLGWRLHVFFNLGMGTLKDSQVLTIRGRAERREGGSRQDPAYAITCFSCCILPAVFFLLYSKISELVSCVRFCMGVCARSFVWVCVCFCMHMCMWFSVFVCLFTNA